MIRRDDKGENPTIYCDRCDRPAPSGAEILAGMGLNNMGWNCSGGVHICPAHTEEAKEE